MRYNGNQRDIAYIYIYTYIYSYIIWYTWLESIVIYYQYFIYWEKSQMNALGKRLIQSLLENAKEHALIYSILFYVYRFVCSAESRHVLFIWFLDFAPRWIERDIYNYIYIYDTVQFWFFTSGGGTSKIRSQEKSQETWQEFETAALGSKVPCPLVVPVAEMLTVL